jgi:hypothetical protein
VKYFQDSARVFFLHVPKTAGTTLRYVLDNFFDADRITPIAMYQPAQFAGVDLSAYNLIRGHLPICATQIMPPDVKIISFMRHPVMRAHSLYWHHRRHQTPLQARALQNGLVDFLKGFGHINFVNNCYTWHYGADFDFRTFATKSPPTPDTTAWSYTLSDKNFELAQSALDNLFYLGITEQFEASLALLCYQFGWFPQRQVTDYNIAPREQAEALSGDEYAALAELNALDMKLYEQGVALFQERYQVMQADLETRFGRNIPKALSPSARVWALLEHHYAERYAQRHPTRVPHLHLHMHKAIDGTGWHPPEYRPRHGWQRWTSHPTALLDLPLATHQGLTLRFRILSALAPDVMDSLQVTLNGHLLAYQVERDTPHTRIVSATLPQTRLASSLPYARLGFHISRTLSPITLNPESTDDRPLGLLFHWLAVD